jgi:hypothetical protein
MADERGDSRVSSFLVGFLVGSLLAGGAATGYFVWQEYRLAEEAKRRAAEANYLRALAAVDLLLVQSERKAAEAERDRAEAALKKAKEE